MKFKIDLDSNTGFVQITGIAEKYAAMEYPIAFQCRGGLTLLSTLKKVLDQVVSKLEIIEQQYHNDQEIKNQYHYGFCVFEPGEMPVTCTVQRNSFTYCLTIGNQLFNQDGRLDVQSLLKSINKFLQANSV